MTRLLLAMFLVPATLALAAEEKTAAPSTDPMAGWVPPKLTNAAKDKQEIQALLQAMEAAGKRGDVDAAAALVDFPVLMATDDSKGEGMAETWTREQWVERMKPFYAKPMADVKVTHKPNVFLLSDSLASVEDVATMKMGARTVTMRNNTLVIRREGKWLVKAMAEGGWGDVMGPAAQRAGGEPGSSEGTGSGEQAPGSQEPGTGMQPPGSQGTETGAPPPPSQGTGTSAPAAPERTTK